MERTAASQLSPAARRLRWCLTSPSIATKRSAPQLPDLPLQVAYPLALRTREIGPLPVVYLVPLQPPP
jgi:hypothetical protein